MSPAMTGADICRAFVRATLPTLDAKAVEREAKLFWEASPDGSLEHVFAAREWLTARGLLPAPPEATKDQK